MTSLSRQQEPLLRKVFSSERPSVAMLRWSFRAERITWESGPSSLLTRRTTRAIQSDSLNSHAYRPRRVFQRLASAESPLPMLAPSSKRGPPGSRLFRLCSVLLIRVLLLGSWCPPSEGDVRNALSFIAVAPRSSRALWTVGLTHRGEHLLHYRRTQKQIDKLWIELPSAALADCSGSNLDRSR